MALEIQAVTPNTKIRAIIGAILGVLQVLVLFGVSVGSYMDWLTGHEAMIVAFASPIMAMIQTWLPSAHKAAAPVKQ